MLAAVKDLEQHTAHIAGQVPSRVLGCSSPRAQCHNSALLADFKSKHEWPPCRWPYFPSCQCPSVRAHGQGNICSEQDHRTAHHDLMNHWQIEGWSWNSCSKPGLRRDIVSNQRFSGSAPGNWFTFASLDHSEAKQFHLGWCNWGPCHSRSMTATAPACHSRSSCRAGAWSVVDKFIVQTASQAVASPGKMTAILWCVKYFWKIYLIFY